MHNLTERSQKTEKTLKTEFVANKPNEKNKFIKNSFFSNKVDTEANPPFTKVANSLFKTIKKTFEVKEGKLLKIYIIEGRTIELKPFEEKPFNAKNNIVKKGKFISMQYNTTVKPKEKKMVPFKQIIIKAKMLNVVSFRELSVESRILMLKRHSKNNFVSNKTTKREYNHNILNNTVGVIEINGNRVNTLNNLNNLNSLNTVSNKTHEYYL